MTSTDAKDTVSSITKANRTLGILISYFSNDGLVVEQTEKYLQQQQEVGEFLIWYDRSSIESDWLIEIPSALKTNTFRRGYY